MEQILHQDIPCFLAHHLGAIGGGSQEVEITKVITRVISEMNARMKVELGCDSAEIQMQMVEDLARQECVKPISNIRDWRNNEDDRG